MMEARNQAERAVFDARKVLSTSVGSLNAEYREKLVRGVGRIEEALRGDDIFEMREATEALREIRRDIGG